MMKRISFFVILGCFLVVLPTGVGASTEWLRKDEAVFFPKDFGRILANYKSFPVFWWNFLVLDGVDSDKSWGQVASLCDRLKASSQIGHVICQPSLGQMSPLLLDWAADYPRRHPRPATINIKQQLQTTLTKASLPLPKGALALLRGDPFESYRVLQQQLKRRGRISLDWKKGFLFDEALKRVVIPIQPNFPPQYYDITEAVAELAVSTSNGETALEWNLIGPHAATLENRGQIEADLNRVSWLGLGALVLLVLGLFALRRGRLLLLIPPVLLGVALSALTLVWLFGQLHGLTLSFGIGIIGLSLDYGFHVALSSSNKRVWRSNAVGLITTWVVLVVLAFSSIPLMRELMIFSILGLLFAFVMLFTMTRVWPNGFSVPAFPLSFRPHRVGAVAVGVLIIGVVVGGVFIRPSLDMKQFDFETAKTQQLMRWMYRVGQLQPPLFQIHSSEKGDNIVATVDRELKWALENKIKVENVAQYLPSVATQRENLASWVEHECQDQQLSKQMTSVERKFFAPFLEAIHCDRLQPRLLQGGSVPRYLQHLNAEDKWLTLWLPSDAEESQKIQAQFPEAVSLLEVVSLFPKTLSRELSWMAPLALFFIGLILFFFYRKLGLVFVALLPFMSGVGLVCWASLLFGLPFSFVSAVALIMVCGLSVDYGIFATDRALSITKGNGSRKGVETALLFASVTTIIGFAPLAFCGHQVLAHLGQTLAFGVLGTMVGAFWGVPFAVNWLYRKQ